MKFTVEFAVGNAMFAEDPDGEDGLISGSAVAGTLRALAARLDDFTLCAADSGLVRDENSGTRIGIWTVKEDE